MGQVQKSKGKMQKLIFEKGMVFGNMTFVDYNTDIYYGHRCGFWECGLCGSITSKQNASIKRGKLKSCGCQGTFNMKKKDKQTNPDYCWEIVCSMILKRYADANKRKRKAIEYSLTPEYVKSIYEKQKGKCFYSGQPIFPPKRFTNLTGDDILSVDRIDSSKGYVEGNIQLVTKQINFMKQTLSHDEFVGLCKLVVERH